MLALRHAATMLGVGGKVVTLEDDDAVDVRSHGSRGAQAGDAAAHHDGGTPQGHSVSWSAVR